MSDRQTQQTAIQQQVGGLVSQVAQQYGMDGRQFWATIAKTIMPDPSKPPSNEQVLAFLTVAQQYGLNPFTKEIYAFPAKGGIQPVVSVDGWAKLINSNAAFNGMTFEDALNDKGELVSVTCKMYRKDRAHPVEATEYMAECARGTEPWKKWPRRMLRHKAMIQAARYAFSFAGIIDPDEAERFIEVGAIESPQLPPEPKDRASKKPTKIMLDALYNQLFSRFNGDFDAIAGYLVDQWGIIAKPNEQGVLDALNAIESKGDVDAIAGDLVALAAEPQELSDDDIPK